MPVFFRRLRPRAYSRVLAILIPATLPVWAQAAEPAHVFDAASARNILSGSTLLQWTDVGPGFNYGGTVSTINLNNAAGIALTPGFASQGTLLTASFQSDGSDTFGVKPQDEPQSSSLGNGLEDGSVEIWFRTDLENLEFPNWQVLWESGAQTNGFAILLSTNGIFPAEMRVIKSWSGNKIVDMTVSLEGFSDADFLQAVVTFDGDTANDGDDLVRLHVKDARGASVVVEDADNDFQSLAGSNDSCAFNATTESGFGSYDSCGGNVGNAIPMSGYQGEIARINVYGVALSDAEVQEAHDALVNRGDDDQDGMSNVWETANGLDPDDPRDAALDPDGDGIDNLGEFQLGTDPNAGDTDGDGLSDGAEVALGADPLRVDTDGDGLTDGDEVSANPFVTDPTREDTDGDQVPDPLELMVGSDPTDAAAVATSILISEFMASNGSTLEDEDGDNSDWIELVNATAAPVDLGGSYLTDDPLLLPQWAFPPGVILQPGEFLLVFASGKNRAVAGRELHANFVLDADGEYLALVAPDGVTVLQEFAPEFPEQKADVSFGFDGLYYTMPSPGERNLGPGGEGFVRDTKFSVDRGFFSDPIVVEITTATPDATIVYTTDSSTPTLRNGTRVEGSRATVTISQTTVLRAAAFKGELAPTNVDTHTYVFPADVVVQSDNVADYEYRNWNNLEGSRTADYGMDQVDIVGRIYPHRQVMEALEAIPTVSIATDAEKLFDRQIGNYANSRQGGSQWERDISMEFFGFEHGRDIQVNGGLRLAGNASRSSNRHKHNMRVAFRREYGSGTLKFPVFDDSEVTTFNSLQLRGGNGDSWVNPGVRDRATYIRDQWHRDVHRAMGGTSQVQRYVHLYINGMYWGVYHLFERIEDDYMVEHFGGNEEDWDVRDHVSAFDGTETAWLQAYTIADHPATMADSRNYEAIREHLDLPSFIDWLLVHFYSNSDDWDQNNVRMARNRVEPDTWKFFCWDQERTMLNSLSSPDVNGARGIDKDTNTNTRKGPTHVHQRLRANPEYRLLFADRVHKHCFHDGALTPQVTTALWNQRVDEVAEAMICESARWGDLHGAAKTPRDWAIEVRREQSGWFRVRTPILLNLLRSRDLYPQVDAPEFTIDGVLQYGGPTPAGAVLGMTAPTGTVYYTLDGSDPRRVGGGVVGEVFSNPLILDRPVTVKARVRAGSEWSALAEAQFSVGTAAGVDNLVVSEIMYHPAGDGAAEYVEVMNISPTDTIDLTGVVFSAGIDFAFPDNFVLEAGERAVIVRDQTAFGAVHGADLPIAGVFANGSALDNAGERLVLEDAAGGVIKDFRYDDEDGWPTGPDGGGPSLVLISPLDNPDHGDPANWRSSAIPSGTPGGEDGTSFRSWALLNGVVDPLEDLEPDGFQATLEYVLGLDPRVAEFDAAPGGVIVADGGLEYLGLEVVRVPGRDDGIISVEWSSDLQAWGRAPADVILVSNTRNADGTETLLYRSTVALDALPRQFLRLVVELQP